MLNYWTFLFHIESLGFYLTPSEDLNVKQEQMDAQNPAACVVRVGGGDFPCLTMSSILIISSIVNPWESIICPTFKTDILGFIQLGNNKTIIVFIGLSLRGLWNETGRTNTQIFMRLQMLPILRYITRWHTISALSMVKTLKITCVLK